MKIEQRESGIELLRFIALLAVIMIHYSDKALPLTHNSINLRVLLLLRSMSSCAVDVFILISGFFMVKSNKRVVGKPISLLAQVVYRNVLVYALVLFLGLRVFELKYFAFRLIPASYYPVFFVVLYIISPYLNLLLTGLSKTALRIFVIIVFFLFSVWPTIVDFSQELFDYTWFGLSTVGAWGNQQGFNIVNFVLLYCIGAWLRLDAVSIRSRNKTIILLFLVLIMINVWSIVCMPLSKHGMWSSWVYHNPLVIVYSVLLFLLFNSFHFKNQYINYVARLVYLCFLIHSGVIANFDIGISHVCNGNILIMLSHFSIFTIAMLVVSFVAYELYNLVSKKIVDKLNTKQIPYGF